MSELNLSACPICHAADGLSRRVYKLPDKTYVSYECQACNSVLLWLGGERWAYQKVGVASMAHLSKRPLTTGDLRALLPSTQPKPDASARSIWRATTQPAPEEPARDLSVQDKADTPPSPAPSAPSSSTWSARDPAAGPAGSQPASEEPTWSVWEPFPQSSPDEDADEADSYVPEGPIRRGQVERSVSRSASSLPQAPVQERRRGASLVVISLLVVLLLLLLAAAFVVGMGLFSGQPTTAPAAIAGRATETPLPTTQPLPTETSPPPTDPAAPRPAPTLVPTLPPATTLPSPIATENPLPSDTPPAEETPEAAETSEPAGTATVTYSMLEIAATQEQYSYHARVAVEFPVTVDQVEAICQQVVQEAQEEGPVFFLTLDIHDTRSLQYGDYSIAHCEYGPNNDAVSVESWNPGNYTRHGFTYEYRPKLSDPDAALSRRPDRRRGELCQLWAEAVYGQKMKVEAAYAQVAEEARVREVDVRDAVTRCQDWALR